MNLTNERSQKQLVLLTILLIIFVGFFALLYYKNPKATLNQVYASYGLIAYAQSDLTNANSITTIPKKSIFAKDLKPLYETPKRLYFESKKIDISLVEVGLESDGKLENPKKWDIGGWFHRSARPGEDGNIIINAHYDDNTGAPAAFWELKNVSTDDKVFLVDSLGKVYTYKVKDTFYVSISDPDRLRVFSDVQDKSELTLITCGGVWDPSEGTYNKRLVVKAELVQQTKNADLVN